MNPYIDYDLQNKRIYAGWSHDGRDYRINLLLEVGATIILHKHHYDHDYETGPGVYDVVLTSPEGVETRKTVKAGEKGSIPAWWKHAITLKEIEAVGQPGRWTCSWPTGADRG